MENPVELIGFNSETYTGISSAKRDGATHLLHTFSTINELKESEYLLESLIAASTATTKCLGYEPLVAGLNYGESYVELTQKAIDAFESTVDELSLCERVRTKQLNKKDLSNEIAKAIEGMRLNTQPNTTQEGGGADFHFNKVSICYTFEEGSHSLCVLAANTPQDDLESIIVNQVTAFSDIAKHIETHTKMTQEESLTLLTDVAKVLSKVIEIIYKQPSDLKKEPA